MSMRKQEIVRYVTPMREGGSLPGLVEADDSFQYVVKLRGAGHGTKVLISELVGGELARAAGFKVPELVFLDLPNEIAITESDIEVQELLQNSRGLNLGLHFLRGAYNLDAYGNHVDELTASKIVWLDAFLLNVDRTARNTNMLDWNGESWLIDHGASMYFHHNWHDRERSIANPFPFAKDHVFIHKASRMREADELMMKAITPQKIKEVMDLIPDDWLQWDGEPMTPAELRAEYTRIMTGRLANHTLFTNEAIKCHENI